MRILDLDAIAVRFLRSRTFWIILILVSFLALAFSFKDLMDYAGIDLRNRIVAARAILSSLDPYSTDWTPGMPLELADPQQRYPGVSRVSAVPPVLFAYIPFANLPHRTQQIIWWVLQWAAMGAAIFSLYRSFDDRDLGKLFLFIAITCIVGSWFWRLHVERGQYYIFITALVCFDLAALRRMTKRTAWLGIPSGISIALRPTHVVLIPLLWFMNEWRMTIKATITAAVILIPSLYIVGWPVWKHYLENVNLAAYLEVDPDFDSKHFGPVKAVAPRVVEGQDLIKELPHHSGQSTIGGLFKAHWAIPLSRATAVLIVIVGAVAMWWMSRQNHIPRDALLLLISMMLVIIDFTRPLRNTYADVAFLPVIAFLLPLIPRQVVFKMFAAVTFLFFLGPLESKWVVHFRHLFFVMLVFSVLLTVVIWKDNLQMFDKNPKNSFPVRGRGDDSSAQQIS
jgi:Glycosyltransferase family 87